MSPDGPSGEPRVIDMDEEIPEYDTLLEAQDTYEELLEELERYSMAKLQGAEVEDELELVRDDIRDTRAYLKVEMEDLGPTDFIVGENEEDYREKAEKLFSPQIDFLEDRFEASEQYRDELRQRI